MSTAQAQNLPPPGGAIQDLAGQPIPHQWTQYTTSFTAAYATTTITFAFRNDPGWVAIDDVTVSTGGGPNLIVNSGFETGSLGPWIYANNFGVQFGGFITTGCYNGGTFLFAPHNGSSFDWCDGATQGYDAIAQTIPTTIGTVYDITYWLNDADIIGTTPADFQELSTNGDTTGVGGNGVDVLVYAQLDVPSVPEPATLVVLGSGLVGLAVARRRKRRCASPHPPSAS